MSLATVQNIEPCRGRRNTLFDWVNSRLARKEFRIKIKVRIFAYMYVEANSLVRQRLKK